MRQILAIDPGRVTGWAASDGCGPAACGSVSFSYAWHDHGYFATAYHRWLCDIIGLVKPAVVVIERQFATPNASTYYLNGLAFITHQVCWLHDIARDEISPSTIKKAVTGNGRATKAQVIAAVQALGDNAGDEHAADACAILRAWRQKTKYTESQESCPA